MAKPKLMLLRHIQYGRERLYPGCDLSKAICKITKGKTLNEDQVMTLIEEGGCEVQVKDVEERPQ